MLFRSREGECFRVVLETRLIGVLKVVRAGKTVPVKIVAKNDHLFVERILAGEAGGVQRAARRYEQAISVATVDGEKVERSLREDRRLIVAQRTADALVAFSPAGPLTRAEVEVVSEHFDTLPLIGLLPRKAIVVSDTWKISNATAQAVCLFDGLISSDLTGTLKSATPAVAVVAIEGTAKGIENGALATLSISATMKYDVTAGRIVAVEWKQKDVRDQGPITPAAEVETATTLTREFLPVEPKELSKAALVAVPAEDETPGLLKQILHSDPKGRYQFLYSRDWHVVGQTDHHVVMRLLERGDFVAQVTITCWKPAGAGKHLSPEEFQKLVATSPGWEMEKVIDRGEVPSDGDRWGYRITAQGDLDGVKVVQNFYVVASPAGEQMIVTFTMKPANLSRLGVRDLAIVNGLEWVAK